MDTKQDFDYIIAGAGCAGLSLAMHLIRSGRFSDKKILLVDSAEKVTNDRTWCFWQKETGLFEDLVYKRWQKLWYHDIGFSKELNIEPYHYKMIRGIDFYTYCLAEIQQQPNFTVLFKKVRSVFSSDSGTGAMVEGSPVRCQYLFNSILFSKPALTAKQYWLLQHFKGWTIETAAPVFNPDMATLMDFRMAQQQGTAFCYVLPFSPTKALIEYTLFSPGLLEPARYDEGLKQYIEGRLGISDYKVIDEEFGVIPMTNFRFPAGYGHIINIGTAGGQTKGSSGYTFNFIQKHSRFLTEALVSGGPLKKSPTFSRFHFYDSVLLHILYRNTWPGHSIFTDLFKKNGPQSVLQFLDNDSSLREDLQIISSLPTLPFLKAAIRQIL